MTKPHDKELVKILARYEERRWEMKNPTPTKMRNLRLKALKEARDYGLRENIELQFIPAIDKYLQDQIKEKKKRFEEYKADPYWQKMGKHLIKVMTEKEPSRWQNIKYRLRMWKNKFSKDKK